MIIDEICKLFEMMNVPSDGCDDDDYGTEYKHIHQTLDKIVKLCNTYVNEHVLTDEGTMGVCLYRLVRSIAGKVKEKIPNDISKYIICNTIEDHHWANICSEMSELIELQWDHIDEEPDSSELADIIKHVCGIYSSCLYFKLYNTLTEQEELITYFCDLVECGDDLWKRLLKLALTDIMQSFPSVGKVYLYYQPWD